MANHTASYKTLEKWDPKLKKFRSYFPLRVVGLVSGIPYKNIDSLLAAGGWSCCWEPIGRA